MAKKLKPPKIPKKMGRPEVPYSEEIVDKICELIVKSPYGLHKICRDNPELPSFETIMLWKTKYKDFSPKYYEAKKHQMDSHIEYCNELADEAPKNKDEIAWTLMNINLRKWQAGRLAPKTYGDKNKDDQTKDLIEETAKETAKRLREQIDKNAKEY